MAETQTPIIFCNIYPDANVKVEVNLPFGMPKIEAPNLTCEGLQIMLSDLTASLSAFYPIIQIASCILKIVDVLKAIPDSLGPPPDPTLLFQRLADLEGCIFLFLGFTGFDPTPFCRFVRDICNVLLKILECLQNLLTITIDNQDAIDVLNGSADANLQLEAACLSAQNDNLLKAMNAKFSSMLLFIILLNAIIAALPPVLAAFGDKFPITPGSTDLTPEAILELIDVLTVIRDVAQSCSGEG